MNEKEKLQVLIKEYDDAVSAYNNFVYYYLKEQTDAINDKFHIAFPDIQEDYCDIVSDSQNERYDEVISWLAEQDDALQKLRENVLLTHKEKIEKLKENRYKAADKVLATTYAQQVLKANAATLLTFLTYKDYEDDFKNKDCIISVIKKSLN